MEKLTVLVSVFLILWTCEEMTMQNVTFYNITKSWKGAADFCRHNGGVLESNITLLKEEITALKGEGKFQIEDVWFGKYRLFTNWTYIKGCFLIHGDFQHFFIENSNTAELQCQLVCNKYKFYSLKGTDCYCIGDIQSFVRRMNCSCVGCYKVWKHLLPDYDTAIQSGKCIAAKECDDGKLKRSYEKCNQAFDVTCDNGAELFYTYSKNYTNAAGECERQGSFIKWHTDSLCVTNRNSIHEYWTCGTRKIKTFFLRKAHSTDHLQLKKCFKLNDDHEEEKANSCNDEFKFFCRFETDGDIGDIISIPNLSMSPKTSVQSDNSRDMIIGIGVSITVVILVLVGIFFMIRRIRSKNLLSLSTIVKDEPSASRMDSNTVTAAYEQLNKADKDNSTHCQSYDQLHSVNVADTVIKTNIRISIEEESKYESIKEPIEKYSNPLTAEYEQLEQTEIVKNTNVYDPLHYTPVEDDPTNARSNNIVSREEYRKYDTSQTENETNTNGIPLEYEQLDITKTDTSTKVYYQLHVTHNAIN